jgi:hypothetical protein
MDLSVFGGEKALKTNQNTISSPKYFMVIWVFLILYMRLPIP